MLRRLKVRYVFPVAGTPVPEGVVTIDRDRIVSVGRGGVGAVEDLGNVAILPGLINAHTHLEFSGLSAPLGQRGMRLTDWIRLVVEHRRQLGDRAREAVADGLQEAIRCGTTTVAEVAQPGWPALAKMRHSAAISTATTSR